MATLEENNLQNPTTSCNTPAPENPHRRTILISVNMIMMILGAGGPLLLRVYFIHGGTRIWLSGFIQNCGSPLLFIPIFFSYLNRRRRTRTDSKNNGTTDQRYSLCNISSSLATACVVVGVLMGASSYLYAFGSSCLPLSTSSLLVATQLAFTAVFALLLVKHKFTAYSINAVVLLTAGPAVLGLHGGGDRPEGESETRYYVGFALTVAAAVMLGLILPLVELANKRFGAGEKTPTYEMVIEMQLVMGVAGSVFCLIGMFADKDFQAIPREARAYGLGEMKYYIVLVCDSIFWQFMGVGLVGLISGGSSLLAGIVIALLLPFAEILSAVFLREKFDGNKGLSLALCLWGFVSYLYGEMKQAATRKPNTMLEIEVATIDVP